MDCDKKWKKPIGIRQLELVESLQIIRDSLRGIKEGHSYQFIPLCGQLRALLYKGKNNKPLLLEVASMYDYKLEIYSLPSVDKTELPIQDGLIFLYLGLELSLFKELPGQELFELHEWIELKIIEYKAKKYSPIELIKFFADKAGGAHYDTDIPQDFAELLTIHTFDQPLIRDAVIKVADIVYQIGVNLIKSFCDLEIYMTIGLPNQTVETIGYIFDAKHSNTSMRLSCYVDSLLRPIFQIVTIHGIVITAQCKRLIDWSEPRLLIIALNILENLNTEILITVDGETVAHVEISELAFIINDPTYYHFYYNRSIEKEDNGLAIGISMIVMYGRIKNLAEKTQIIQYISQRVVDDNHFCLFYNKGVYSYAPPGTKDMTINGKAIPWSFTKLCEGNLPEK